MATQGWSPAPDGVISNFNNFKKIIVQLKIYVIAYLFSFICCNNNIISPKIRSLDTAEKASKYLQKSNVKRNVESGIYSNNLVIAIDSIGNLTACYQYYDKWNERSKEYTDINTFYFFGTFNGDSCKITCNWPTFDNKISGMFYKLHDSVNLVLDEQPPGYSDVDFTERQEFKATVLIKKDWNEIGLIKVKTFFNSEPDINKNLKMYVVKNDVVKVIQEKGSWLQVEFNPINSQKSYNGWITKNSLSKLN